MRVSSSVGLVVSICLAACHLADDPDPLTCEPGMHPENGRCLLDPFVGQVLTITPTADGASCSVSPSSIRVQLNELFLFKNEDVVDHAISGEDGRHWATAEASRNSPGIGISGAGTWRYQVAGCASGGAVVVE